MKILLCCMGAVFFALVLSTPGRADQLDFDRVEFKSTWRKQGTGNKITFDKRSRTFAVEFGGQFISYNTSGATYSHCNSGRDGGGNLCVSGRSFDCAFLVTISTGNIANLDLRRAGMGDEFCRGMAGDYAVLLN